jgi:hypothetical protein
MVIGETRRFWIPGASWPMAMHRLRVVRMARWCSTSELLEVKKGPKPIPAPADVKAAPADALKTASGLASKVLQKGKGTEKPTAEDSVESPLHRLDDHGRDVRFVGVMRGQTATFPLGQRHQGLDGRRSADDRW